MEHWAFLRRAERQQALSNTPIDARGDFVFSEQRLQSEWLAYVRTLPILHTVSEVAVQSPTTGVAYFMMGFSALEGSDTWQ